jgi:hypothetical protein
MKFENKTTDKIPPKTFETLQNACDTVPLEHLRGLSRVVLVDFVRPEGRLHKIETTHLPGLYHPRLGAESPWMEIALGVLLPPNSFFKRIIARLNYKANLASVFFSLQAQHYYLTLSHGIKKHQYESAIKSYAEKYQNRWLENYGGIRSRLFKPFRPYIEKWARKLNTKLKEEKNRRELRK